jgi:hypothetical protein
LTVYEAGFDIRPVLAREKPAPVRRRFFLGLRIAVVHHDGLVGYCDAKLTFFIIGKEGLAAMKTGLEE